MKKWMIALICISSFQSCAILKDDIGHRNYLTRIRTSRHCHHPKRLPVAPYKSTASLPGGGSSSGGAASFARSGWPDAKPDRFWLPPR